jgi:hypothetical protein
MVGTALIPRLFYRVNRGCTISTCLSLAKGVHAPPPRLVRRHGDFCPHVTSPLSYCAGATPRLLGLKREKGPVDMKFADGMRVAHAPVTLHGYSFRLIAHGRRRGPARVRAGRRDRRFSGSLPRCLLDDDSNIGRKDHRTHAQARYVAANHAKGTAATVVVARYLRRSVCTVIRVTGRSRLRTPHSNPFGAIFAVKQ